MKFEVNEFYPTPRKLIEKMLADVKWSYIKTVLEPSAGKGDIVKYIMERTSIYQYSYKYDIDIDCIEIDPELRNVLKGENIRVVADDFLTFRTFKKYDLIVMNPPFHNGAEHLLKALEMQANGGGIVCILNAETLKNPFSIQRKSLVHKLNELQADIQYLQEEFVNSEHPTKVEIAIIKVWIPQKELKSSIYESLKQKFYEEHSYDTKNELMSNDYVRAIISQYELEVESGVRLIQEYRGLMPHMSRSLNENDRHSNEPILELKILGKPLSVNEYVRKVREKYWTALFNNKKFTGNMTSNLRNEYMERVKDLQNYDFSYYNIKCMQLDMCEHLISGIEECIIKLFDELSFQYAYSDELSSNIHYFNGWKTNKCWYINKKVIIPYMNAFDQLFKTYKPDDYYIMKKLHDIENALNYLDGGLSDGMNMEYTLREARKNMQTKKIQLKYFTVTFYKKGTCHLEFSNEKLLKKLNIYGCQKKKWLPPGYGKQKYQDMTPEEQSVINSFEGKKSYDNMMSDGSFLFEPCKALIGIETKE